MGETRGQAMTEGMIQQGVISCARRLGFLVYHVTYAMKSEPGFPDVVIVGNGCVLVFEFKNQRGRLRVSTVTKRGRELPGQQDWLDEFNAAGVPAFVVRPQATADAIGYQDALDIIQGAYERGNMVQFPLINEAGAPLDKASGMAARR